MRWKLALILVITTLCIGWVVLQVDNWPVLLQGLTSANYLWVAPVFAVYLTNHCIRSVRLRMLLDRPDIPFRDMFAITTVGFLAINVVPLRLGEFVRPYLLMERHDVNFGSSLAAIVVERLVDLICLMILLLMVAALVEFPETGLRVQGVEGIEQFDPLAVGQKVVGVGIGGGVVFLVALAAVGKPLIALVVRLIPFESVRGKVERLLTSFYDGLIGLIRRPAQGALVVLMSVTMWAGIVAATWSVMMGFDGVPASFETALTTWTVTITGMTLAPTPGFFGSYEAFCMAALSLWDVDQNLGLAFAGTLHLTQFLFIVGLGAIFLIKEGLSLRNVVESSREAMKGA